METQVYGHTTQSASLSDYLALLKPRVMSLVVFSGFTGMWLAPGFETLNPFLILVAIASLALGSGAAGAFNMWYERALDAKMNRTKNRPLPLGKIAPDDALGFSIFASLFAFMMLGLATNWIAAGLLAFASFFYVVIYTVLLKPRTPQNIVIGGAAGAFPPMIGWAAVTGDVTLFPLLLFAIIFFWTPPHFWALSLFANEDYKRAGIPMMPVVKGIKRTKVEMLVYTFVLFPLTLAPTVLGFAGFIYGITAFVLSAGFIYTSLRVLKNEDLKPARQMFAYSVFYLFALYLALMVDHLRF